MADLTVEILTSIRDEIRETNQRLDKTRVELGERLDKTRVELGERLDKVEGTLVELAEQQRFVVRYMKSLAERDSRLDADVADLRVRVEALEARVDPK